MIADGISLEQTVLGHALNDQECYRLFLNEVDWNFFSASNHKVIAFCLKQMGDLGINKPDEDSFQLVVNNFPEDDKDYGGAEYIRQLKSAFFETTENYKQFTDRLKLCSIKSTIGSKRLTELVRVCNDPTSEISQIRSIIQQVQRDVEFADSTGYQFKDSVELGDEYIQTIEERKDLKFYTTGFTDLDELLSEGFAPKQVTVMAGFTGMAKSTVAINMAHRIAVQGIGTALFSMESTGVSMMDKLVATLTQIPLSRLKKEAAQLDDREKANIVEAIEDLKSLPIIINDQASVTIDGILYQLESAKRRGHNPKVIFIDLFGKIEDVDTGDNLAARIQREMKRIRVLAKQLDVHFVCVVQVGRQGFGKAKGGRVKRPTLIDIKNANAYAEEANVVILLHRNKYYIPSLEDDILEFILAKQRDGESNQVVYFEFFPETSTIMDTDKTPFDVVNNRDNQNND